MASFPLLFSFLFLSLVHAQSSLSFHIPVTKDGSTLQYLTTLSYGTPLVPTKLVLDLGGPFLWLHCASRNTPSSSTLTTPHRSIQCLTAKTHKPDDSSSSSSFLSSPVDEDQYQPCQVLPENSITGTVATEGELVEDLMAVQSSHLEIIHQVSFTCSPTSMLLNGLAKGARGMVGLGRSRSSLPSQVFDSFSTHRKITLCLSSSKGVVLFGDMAYYESSPAVTESLKSLTFTPLVTNFPSQEYFINVNSIKINGKRLSLDTSSQSLEQENSGGALTLLSSIVPYTTMQSSIYATFKATFLDAAVALNMTIVASVAPFELCFEGSHVGASVPAIELVLQSEMVKWSIHGRNSMVRVSSEVVCLGFLDGGVNPRNPIIIGGYQLEEVIVQFDLATSMVGFSSSLYTKNTGCSHFRFGSMLADSV
ncbi:basic 7S globulin [Abrus precatorius]|uniref:Basic 7S globulin n=1 Tax=Abrus precatorius TaxID=3816 RepID=A0A8B8JJQ6_ABRPR|nr:basic 7S globulin [Abrus precatorius]